MSRRAPARSQQPGPSDGAGPAEQPVRPPGDPVRELMDQHRVLCEQAVDALEIAAALEDAGLGPAEARRYRHADVFALAEELYARVPRRPPAPAPPPRGTPWRQRAGRALRSAALHALPCAVLLATRALPPSAGVPAVLACGAGLALGAGRWTPARLGYGVGVAFVLLVPLVARESGGAALGLAAAVGMGSVEWSVGWLGQAARGHLGSAWTLAEFRARLRPALPVAILLHLAVLAVLGFAALAVLTVFAPLPGPGGLLHEAAHRASAAQWAALAVSGLLLVPAAFLLRSGRAAPAAVGLLAAGGGSALLTALRYAPATAQLLCCGAVAVFLLLYAGFVLGRPETSAVP